MPTEGRDATEHSADDATNDTQALRAAMGDALAAISDEDRAAIPDRAVYGGLGAGIRLALERPHQARRVLELIEAGAGEGSVNGTRPEAVGTADSQSPADSGHSEGIPVASMLLARAASLSEAESGNEGAASSFGWAARLTRVEILSLGRAVEDMLAAGAPPDIARGFGIVWDAGVRLPRRERDGLLPQFTELEITVGEVLAGRELRVGQQAPRPTGLEALLTSWLRQPIPGESEASAVIDRSGDQAKGGLIALWNAWAAMRFRSLIPRPTFELLVQPWVNVVGPLPES